MKKETSLRFLLCLALIYLLSALWQSDHSGVDIVNEYERQ